MTKNHSDNNFNGLEVYIHADNPAFIDSNIEEVARLLRSVADRIEKGETFGYIYDSTNSYAGTFRFQA